MRADLAVIHHVQVHDRGGPEPAQPVRQLRQQRLKKRGGACVRQRHNRRLGAQAFHALPVRGARLWRVGAGNGPILFSPGAPGSASMHLDSPGDRDEPLGAPAEPDLDARPCQRLAGRLADRCAEGRRMKADVTRVRSGQQPGAKHERRERERGLRGGEVQRRQGDQVPQRADRGRALAVTLEPIAERQPIERLFGARTERVALRRVLWGPSGAGRLKAHQGERGPRGAEPLSDPQMRVTGERPRQMQRRGQRAPA